MTFWQNALSIMAKMALNQDEEDKSELDKFILVNTSVLISVAAIIWGTIYLVYDELTAGFIPLFYSVLSIISLMFLKKYNHFEWYRFSQIFLIMLLPFVLMIQLGGYINGSAVVIWGLLGPIGALLSGHLRQARYWFFIFVCLIIFSGVIQPYLRISNNLPDSLIILFFIFNIIAVSFIAFLVLNHFVHNKSKVIELIKENRELEIAKLEKEVMLRQNDKLATLGRMSAGIAHELKNPVAAAAGGSKHLKEFLEHIQKHVYALGHENLSDKQLAVYKQFKEQIINHSTSAIPLNPVQLSDNEDAIEGWLEDQEFENVPVLAAALAKLGFGIDTLTILAKDFSAEQFSAVIQSLYATYQSNNLLQEIGTGMQKITEIIKSLKSYSYENEIPAQSTDIHEGLNDTLIILRNQLKDGIDVQLIYENTLPLIQAHSSELIQVWTNIIDNAIVAMKNKGKIVIKTYSEDNWIVVAITDNGPGIPEDLQKRIFDPFFTTKLPGEGTGLGLNISNDIIVNRHKGMINVFSKPGETCFEVKLPLNNQAIN